MKIRSTLIVLSACLVAASVSVNAQSKTSGETKLVGVSLYDSGLKLIKMFGSPIEIQAVTLGGGGGGGAAGGGAPGMPGGRGGGAAGGGGGSAAEAQLWMDPFGPESLLQFGEEEGRGRNRSGGQMGPPPGTNIPRGPGQMGGPSGAPLGPGGAPGGFGGPGGAPGASRAMGGATSTESATFTRWVYKRPTSRYAFILDKFNRVVQIEVIGLSDPRVRTKRGIGLGATFGQIMGKYSRPDGYDISGDSMVLRFLVRDKVAFRLSRLEPNKPHRVTGVVVAAGKQ